MTTGYNVREGSAMLAERFDRDGEVAEAILRRWRLQRAARAVLVRVAELEGPQVVRINAHPESRRV